MTKVTPRATYRPRQRAGQQNTPIIVANTQWDLPETLIKSVKVERMISGLIDMASGGKLDYKDLVGDAEVVAYLNPATSQAPLRSDVTQIYFYCFTRMMKKQGIEVPKECEVNELDEYLLQKLDKFKQWIFEKRGGRERNPVIDSLKEVFKI